jgi:hypothetical protein
MNLTEAIVILKAAVPADEYFSVTSEFHRYAGPDDDTPGADELEWSVYRQDLGHARATTLRLAVERALHAWGLCQPPATAVEVASAALG